MSTLESVILIVDNDEHSRNTDYSPNRLASQADALHLVGSATLDRNAEATVGLLPAAGGPGSLSLTTNIGLFFAAVASVRCEGRVDVERAIARAALALKQRQNKALRQRIVLFAGSPSLDDSEATAKRVEKLGKKLKKNSVSIDIVLFGECADATSPTGKALTSLAAAASSTIDGVTTCHVITIPPLEGGVILSDRLVGSPLLSGAADVAMGGDGEGGVGGDAGGNFAEYGGIDPSLDPELALAMQMSLQEERAREQGAAQGADEGEGGAAGGADVPATPVAGEAAVPAAAPGAPRRDADARRAAAAEEEDDDNVDDEDDEDDEAELAAALALSMGEAGVAGGEDEDSDDDMPPLDDGSDVDDDAVLAAALASSLDDRKRGREVDVGEASDDDEEMALAIAMSLAAGKEEEEKKEGGGEEENGGFLASVVASLPGVDVNDPRVQEELEKARKAGKKDDK